MTALEMPRLDGFQLIARIRREATLRGLPIVVLSSRTSQGARDRALAAGARAATAAASSPPLPPAYSSAKTASHPRAKARGAEAKTEDHATSLTRLPTTFLCGGNGMRTPGRRGQVV